MKVEKQEPDFKPVTITIETTLEYNAIIVALTKGYYATASIRVANDQVILDLFRELGEPL